MKKFVIAGTSDQFYDWMRKNGYSHTIWRYLSGPEALRGTSNPQGIFIGTWYERKDMVEVIQLLRLNWNFQNKVLDEVAEIYKRKRLDLDWT